MNQDRVEDALAAAERALGQVPDSEVFIRPVKKSMSTQLQRAFVIGVAGFVAILVNDNHCFLWRQS
jgi:hypothetical protein